MRLMRGAGGVVNKERLVVGHGIVLMQPLDGMIGDVGGEVVAILAVLSRAQPAWCR